MSDLDESQPTDTADCPAEIEAKLVELLARREHSQRELIRKLEQRGYEAGEVQPILDALTAQRLQSDERFAESFAWQRQQRGYGPLRIRMELRERGVDDGLVETALAALDVDWFDQARAARHKRFGTAMPEDFREKARQLRYLQNRGFDAEQSRFALEGAGD